MKGLEVKSISKAFSGVPVLRDVSLCIPAGSILGLIGENGAGKSTLMNIIGGNLSPDTGELLLDGQTYQPASPRDAQIHGIGLVHQEQNLFPNLSIGENLFLSNLPRTGPFISASQLRYQASRLLARVGLDAKPSTLLSRLSIGQRQLVELARVLATDAQFLLLDEPTTSWSDHECERFFQLIKELALSGKAIVLITHAIGDVLKHCDTVAVLRDGAVVECQPTATATANQLVASMVGRPLKEFFPVRNQWTQPLERAPVRLSVRDVSQPSIVDRICFDLHQREVLGLYGLMGAGRTELARMIFGLDRYRSGEIVLDGTPLRGDQRARINQGLAFVTESRRQSGICPPASLADNLSLAALPRYRSDLTGLLRQAELDRDVDTMKQACSVQSTLRSEQPIWTLSGGNQQKIVLGKWLLADPKVLILDEPTRGVDIGAKYEIYRLIHTLADSGKSVLVISSDLDELMGICDRILVMSLGRMTADLARDVWGREPILSAALAMHRRDAEQAGEKEMVAD